MPLSDEFAQVYSLADSIRIWMVRSLRRLSLDVVYLNILQCTVKESCGAVFSISDSRSNIFT